MCNHIFSGGGVWLLGQADLQLVLRLLDRMTLCLTPQLKAEPRQARPLLADKERILSLPLSSQPWGWGTNERPREDRVAGIGRLTEPKRAREGRYWERNVSSLSTCARRPAEVLPYWHFSSQDGLAKSHPGCQMLPWRSPVSLREEAFVFTPEMPTAWFPPKGTHEK